MEELEGLEKKRSERIEYIGEGRGEIRKGEEERLLRVIERRSE